MIIKIVVCAVDVTVVIKALGNSGFTVFNVTIADAMFNLK